MENAKMSDNFLAKEKEYHRINKELEQKTKNIMLEVESVINSHVDPTTTSAFCKKHYSNSMENISIYVNSKSENQTDNGIYNRKCVSASPKSKSKKENEVSKKESENDTVVQFLKTKVQMLHEELNMIQTEYKKQSNSRRELEAECKKHEVAKKKLQNQIVGLHETVSKLEVANSSLQIKVDAQKTEITALKKDVDELKKELRNCQNQSSSSDVRLNRSLEENESLKSALKFSQLEEKELRDKFRKLQESSKVEVKNLEKQRAELLQAYKKQMLLVDNLKKQTAYLEASKQIHLTEAEFLKLLEWKPDGA